MDADMRIIYWCNLLGWNYDVSLHLWIVLEHPGPISSNLAAVRQTHQKLTWRIEFNGLLQEMAATFFKSASCLLGWVWVFNKFCFNSKSESWIWILKHSDFTKMPSLNCPYDLIILLRLSIYWSSPSSEASEAPSKEPCMYIFVHLLAGKNNVLVILLWNVNDILLTFWCFHDHWFLASETEAGIGSSISIATLLNCRQILLMGNPFVSEYLLYSKKCFLLRARKIVIGGVLLDVNTVQMTTFIYTLCLN